MKKHVPLLLGVLLLACLMSTVFAAPAYADGSVSINETNFPDEAFRAYVSQVIDDGDGILSEEEIANTTVIAVGVYDSWLNSILSQEQFDFIQNECRDKIESLKGIEYFTNLRELYAVMMAKLNGVVDLSYNKELRSITMPNIIWVNGKSVIGDARVTEVKLGSLPKLENARFTNHYALRTIDVSQCPALDQLDLAGTSIETLDVSSNKDLRVLACNYTFLSELDVSGNTKLEELNAFNIKNPFTLTLGNLPGLHLLTTQNTPLDVLDISGCPLLIAQLKDEYYQDRDTAHFYESEAGEHGSRLWYDKTTRLELGGIVPVITAYFPDEAFRRYVSETWDKDGDNILSEEEIAAAQNINLSENDTWKNGIASLDGIQYFTNLRYLRADAMPKLNCALDFSNNRELRSIKMSNIVFVNGEGQNVGGRLSSVTLGNLPKLRELNLTNQYVIKSIDVSQCPAIENLSLGGTSISALDVSKNKNLVFLGCNHTFLSELDVSNNTQLFGLNVFSIKVPFSLTLGNLPDMRALAAQYSHMDKLDISGCPLLLGLLKEEYYADRGDYHSYETAPGNDGSRVFYDKHVLLQTEKNQVFTTLTMPASLTRIEEDAFAGTVADTAVLPENCVSIGSRAFADCPKLQIVYAPAAAVFDEHAFDGCGHVYISRTE